MGEIRAQFAVQLQISHLALSRLCVTLHSVPKERKPLLSPSFATNHSVDKHRDAMWVPHLNPRLRYELLTIYSFKRWHRVHQKGTFSDEVLISYLSCEVKDVSLPIPPLPKQGVMVMYSLASEF